LLPGSCLPSRSQLYSLLNVENLPRFARTTDKQPTPPKTMKRAILSGVAAVVFILLGTPTTKAQSALFIYNDGNGVPNAGTYTPGSTFTFSITLTAQTGGTIQNLDGLSYWFQQTNPSIAPYPFSITLRDPTGSIFNSLQSPGLTYP